MEELFQDGRDTLHKAGILMKLAGLTRNDTFRAANREIEMVLFNDVSDIHIEHLMDVDGVMLDAADPDMALDILRRLRSSDIGDIYLKPVFLCCIDEVRDEYLRSLSDGVIEPPMDGTVAFAKMSQLVEKVRKKLESLEPQSVESFEIAMAMRVLRFMYSRDLALEPVLVRTSRIGLTYPVIGASLKNEEEHRVFDILSFLEREQLIEGDYVDRINLCNSCYGAFLNFREVCGCGSSDLKLEDVYHHFTCAYVGPESDFGHTGELVCPKCRKNLKHIGLDYDKPSVIYTCRKCQQRFQNAEVKAFCFSCRNDAPVENLLSREIKKYTLTYKGEQSAIFGIRTSMKDVISFGGLIDFNVFKAIIHYEIERMKRVRREGCVAFLHFENFQDMYLHGAHKEKIFTEIVELIRDTIRPSDVLSYLNESTLMFFFSDTTAESARIPVERLHQNLRKLIRDNFETFEPQINTELAALSPEIDLNGLLNRVRSE